MKIATDEMFFAAKSTFGPPCAKVDKQRRFCTKIRQSCMQQCFNAHLTPDKKAEVRRNVIHPFRMSHSLDNVVR